MNRIAEAKAAEEEGWRRELGGISRMGEAGIWGWNGQMALWFLLRGGRR